MMYFSEMRTNVNEFVFFRKVKKTKSMILTMVFDVDFCMRVKLKPSNRCWFGKI